MRRTVFTLAVVALALGACAGDVEPEQQQAVAQQTDTVLMSVPTEPTISFSIWFKVGSQNDPIGKEGLAFLTAQMLADASTENNPYEDILEKLYPIASNYRIRVDREMTTLTGRTHRDNIEVFSSLFTDAYLRPAFADSDFQRVKNDTINYLENALRYSSDEELAKATLNQQIYDGTRYAHPPEGTVDGLSSITLDDIRGFYRQHFTTFFADRFAERPDRQRRSRVPDGTDAGRRIHGEQPLRGHSRETLPYRLELPDPRGSGDDDALR